jgi:hypothetical protein
LAAAVAALQERNARLSARFQNDFKLIGGTGSSIASESVPDFLILVPPAAHAGPFTC